MFFGTFEHDCEVFAFISDSYSLLSIPYNWSMLYLWLYCYLAFFRYKNCRQSEAEHGSCMQHTTGASDGRSDSNAQFLRSYDRSKFSCCISKSRLLVYSRPWDSWWLIYLHHDAKPSFAGAMFLTVVVALIQEATELSDLFVKVDAVFAQGNVVEMAEVLSTMRRSLALVGDVPEFKGGKEKIKVGVLCHKASFQTRNDWKLSLKIT